MSRNTSSLHIKVLLTTTAIAIFTLPGIAHAQLVSTSDLIGSVDASGNQGAITISNNLATQSATIDVLAASAVAEWAQFNVPEGADLTVQNGSGAAEAFLMNRVIGDRPSDIGGTITATDVNLWLINQNGIIFGENASITASSFVASTLDVTDEDFFGLGDGTTEASVNFAGASQAALTSTGATFDEDGNPLARGATFNTDGTLFFASQELDLDGTFDAGTGRASFVAAADVDVQFTPGSPLGYTITGGTTVATQSVAGSVEGAGIDFQFVTASGVVDALLQVDASLTATTAIPTENGILLRSAELPPQEGPPLPPAATPPTTIRTSNTIDSSGTVIVNVQGDYTSGADMSGSSVDINVSRDLNLGNVNATVGDIDTNSGTITANQLASEGGIFVESPGDINLASARARGELLIGIKDLPNSVTVDFSGGSRIGIQARGPVNMVGALSSAGAINISSELSDITTGSMVARGGDFILTAPGNIQTGVLNSTDGVTVSSTAGGSVDLGAVLTGNTLSSPTAVNDVDISTTGSVELDAVLSEGNLTITNASSVTASDRMIAERVNIDIAGPLTGTNIEATSGSIDIVSTSVSLLDLVASDDILIDAPGLVAVTSARAGDALVIGGNTPPSSVVASTAGGGFEGRTVDIVATGVVFAPIVSSTGGGINILSQSGDIEVDIVDAEGGDARLNASGDITTDDVSATENIDLDSSSNGNLLLGDLSAGGTVDLDAGLSISVQAITAGDALTVGATTRPSDVFFDGNAVAGSVNVESEGVFRAQDVTATAGAIRVESRLVEAGALDASEDVIIVADSDITTESIASGGIAFVNSTGGGTLDLGAINVSGDVDLETVGQVLTGPILSGGALVIGGFAPVASLDVEGDITSESVQLDSVGAVTTLDITATSDSVDIQAGAVDSGWIMASDDVVINSPGDITTTSILAGNLIDVESANGGALDLGDLEAGATIDLDTSGTVLAGTAIADQDLRVGASTQVASAEFTGDIGAGSVDINSVGGFSAVNITTTVPDDESSDGTIDIDSGSVTAGRLNGASDIEIDASGSVALESAIAVDDLTIGATTLPSTVLVADIAQGGRVDIQSFDDVSLRGVRSLAGGINVFSAEGDIESLTVEASGGDAVLNASGGITTGIIRSTGLIDVDSRNGGVLDVGALESSGDIDLDTTAAVRLEEATAGGSFTVGALAPVASVDSRRGIVAGSVDIDSAGAMNAGDITSTSGGVDINSQSASAGAVMSADTVTIEVTNNVTTASITADSMVDVDSLDGGTLNVGNLDAGTTIDLDTTGSVIVGDTVAGGQLTVGAVTSVATASFGSETVAESLDINSVGALSAGNMSATNGSVDLDVTNGDVTAGALSATDDVFVDATGAVTLSSARAGDILAIGDAVSPQSLTISGASEGGIVELQGELSIDVGDVTAGAVDVRVASGGITAEDVTATNGDVVLTAPGDIETNSINATNAIDVDSTDGGALSLGNMDAGDRIDVDTTGTVSAGQTTAGSDLTVGGATPVGTAEFTGNVVAGNVAINSVGDLSAMNISTTFSEEAETAGSIDIDSGAVTAGALMSAGNVFVDATGSVLLGSVNAAETVAIDATTLTVTGASQGANVDVQALAGINLGDVNSTSGGIDIQSTRGSITSGSVNARGGDAVLLALGRVSSTAIGATRAVNVRSAGRGTLNLGDLSAGTTLDANTGGSVTIGAATVRQELTIGAIAQPSSVTLNGPVEVEGLSVTTSGLFTAASTIDAGPLARITSSDIELLGESSLSATNVLLSASPTGEVYIGDDAGPFLPTDDGGDDDGDGEGSGGGDSVRSSNYVLSDAELGRIVATGFALDAEESNINIGGVVFTDETGANIFNLLTSGEIRLRGSLTANGAGRLFRFGQYEQASGDGDGDGEGDGGVETRFTNRLIANIDQANFDFGEATLELSAADIVFGSGGFIDEVADRSSADISEAFISNSGSTLYNLLQSGPLSEIRAAGPVYLRAGNLVVTYENTAVFQNAGFVSNSFAQTAGAVIGDTNGSGTLTINAIDDSNAFAIFGSINAIAGELAALAGPSVLITDDNLQATSSYVNGCIIGSAANCVVTQIGTSNLEVPGLIITVQAPRPDIIVLGAESDLLVPFDPLVGTNNEGLFSDAASAGEFTNCVRDDDGQCIVPQGAE